MKHIKLFEGYLDNYYTKITEEEWMGLVHDSDSFPEKSEAKLMELLDGEIEIDSSANNYGRLKIKYVEDSIPIWVNIDYVKDDYYIVNIYSRSIVADTGEFMGHVKKGEFWKCDQFEGLVKFLEDKGFIS